MGEGRRGAGEDGAPRGDSGDASLKGAWRRALSVCLISDFWKSEFCV